MAIDNRELVALDQDIEIVSMRIRIQTARQLHRAQHARRKRSIGACELVLEKAVVETRVVRDEHATVEQLFDLACE